MKSLRQSAILKLIETEAIETQEELGERLRQMGYTCTQATLSRDIQQLQLVKVSDATRKYRYAVDPGRPDEGKYLLRYKVIFAESVIGVDCAGNIVCLKTLNGMANAAAAAIDAIGVPNVVGTLAGDDTVFILVREAAQAIALGDEIKGMLR